MKKALIILGILAIFAMPMFAADEPVVSEETVVVEESITPVETIEEATTE